MRGTAVFLSILLALSGLGVAATAVEDYLGAADRLGGAAFGFGLYGGTIFLSASATVVLLLLKKDAPARPVVTVLSVLTLPLGIAVYVLAKYAAESRAEESLLPQYAALGKIIEEAREVAR